MAISTDFDELDSRIAAALQANGRASWGLIATAIDAPVRTIARRGQRLLDVGAVRVSTYLDTTRVGDARPLVIQISTRPGHAVAVARALATRADASSVSVLESGADVICQLMPRTPEESARLVVEELPELDHQPSDITVTKRTLGAFGSTDLDAKLREVGATQIVLTGVSTTSGVESTARSAYELGYHVAFVVDAMSDVAEAHEASIAYQFPKLGELGTTAEVLELLAAR